MKYEEVYLKAYANASEASREPTSGSITTRGPTKPWATGPRLIGRSRRTLA